MRSSLAFATHGTLAAILIACGGSNPPAKTAAEGKEEAPAASTDKAEDTAAPADKKEEKTEAAAAPKEPEQKCPHNLDQVATSKAGSVKVITGCVSPEKSLKLIEQYYPQLHACFNAEARANPKSKGEINVKIMVGQNGTYSVRLSKMEVTSEEFVKCAVGVLEPLPYPKPDFGGATIEYTAKLK